MFYCGCGFEAATPLNSTDRDEKVEHFTGEMYCMHEACVLQTSFFRSHDRDAAIVIDFSRAKEKPKCCILSPEVDTELCRLASLPQTHVNGRLSGARKLATYAIRPALTFICCPSRSDLFTKYARPTITTGHTYSQLPGKILHEGSGRPRFLEKVVEGVHGAVHQVLFLVVDTLLSHVGQVSILNNLRVSLLVTLPPERKACEECWMDVLCNNRTPRIVHISV